MMDAPRKKRIGALVGTASLSFKSGGDLQGRHRLLGERPLTTPEMVQALGSELKKFRDGRKPGTGGPVRRAIAKLLKRRPAGNSVLWEALSSRPPRGWQFFDNRMGKYCEGPGKAAMGYRRFCNVAAEERAKLKS